MAASAAAAVAGVANGPAAGRPGSRRSRRTRLSASAMARSPSAIASNGGSAQSNGSAAPAKVCGRLRSPRPTAASAVLAVRPAARSERSSGWTQAWAWASQPAASAVAMRARRPSRTASGAAAARASSRASASVASHSGTSRPASASPDSQHVRAGRRCLADRRPGAPGAAAGRCRFRPGCPARTGGAGPHRRRHRRTGVLQASVCFPKPLVSLGQHDRSAPIRARWICHFGGFRPPGRTRSRTRENGRKEFRPIILLCGRRTDVLVCPP